MESPSKLRVRLASDLIEDELDSPKGLGELRRKTVAARREFVAWLSRIDPSAVVIPAESEHFMTFNLLVETSAEASNLLLAQETRPSIVDRVELRDSWDLEFAVFF